VGLVYDSLAAATDQFEYLDGGLYAARLYAYDQNLSVLDEYGNAYTFSQFSHQFDDWAQSKLCSSECPCTNYSTPEVASPWPPQPSFNCSGTCPCTPATSTWSGVLSNGPDSPYDKNLDCSWILAGQTIVLVFTSFETVQYYDPVTINQCSDAACRSATLS
jgi:hypothetical protein